MEGTDRGMVAHLLRDQPVALVLSWKTFTKQNYHQGKTVL